MSDEQNKYAPYTYYPKYYINDTTNTTGTPISNEYFKKCLEEKEELDKLLTQFDSKTIALYDKVKNHFYNSFLSISAFDGNSELKQKVKVCEIIEVHMKEYAFSNKVEDLINDKT